MENDKNLILAIGCDHFLESVKTGYAVLIDNDGKGFFENEVLMPIHENDIDKIKEISEGEAFVSFLIIEKGSHDSIEIFKNQKCGKPDLVS